MWIARSEPRTGMENVFATYIVRSHRGRPPIFGSGTDRGPYGVVRRSHKALDLPTSTIIPCLDEHCNSTVRGVCGGWHVSPALRAVGLGTGVVSKFRPRRVVSKKSSQIKVSTRKPRATSNRGGAALIVPRYDHVQAVPCNADPAWESPAIGLARQSHFLPDASPTAGSVSQCLCLSSTWFFSHLTQ